MGFGLFENGLHNPGEKTEIHVDYNMYTCVCVYIYCLYMRDEKQENIKRKTKGVVLYTKIGCAFIVCLRKT